MSNLGSSIVRTIVPILVGYLIALGLKVGIALPEGALTELLGVVVIAVYYAVVRFLEEKVSPQFGRLLGLRAKVSYDAPAKHAA